MNDQPKYDELTLLTLRVIALEEALKKIPDYKIGISNLSARLKSLEDLKIAQEIEILAVQVKTNKKLIDEINEERLNKEVQKDAEFIRELKIPQKKFSIMDWFR